MDTKLLILLGLGLAIYFGGGDSSNSGENYYRLPDGREVPESELEALGYVKYLGKWVKQTELLAALQANHISTLPPESSPSAWTVLSTILQTGIGLTNTIINNIAAAKQAKINDILVKYTLPSSPNYSATFPYTTAMLNAFDLPKLNLIFNGNMTVHGLETSNQYWENGK